MYNHSMYIDIFILFNIYIYIHICIYTYRKNLRSPPQWALPKGLPVIWLPLLRSESGLGEMVLFFMIKASYPICSMVLEYLPTKLGHKKGVNVGKYTSTMEHWGSIIWRYKIICFVVCNSHYRYIYPLTIIISPYGGILSHGSAPIADPIAGWFISWNIVFKFKWMIWKILYPYGLETSTCACSNMAYAYTDDSSFFIYEWMER